MIHVLEFFFIFKRYVFSHFQWMITVHFEGINYVYLILID